LRKNSFDTNLGGGDFLVQIPTMTDQTKKSRELSGGGKPVKKKKKGKTKTLTVAGRFYLRRTLKPVLGKFNYRKSEKKGGGGKMIRTLKGGGDTKKKTMANEKPGN